MTSKGKFFTPQKFNLFLLKNHFFPHLTKKTLKKLNILKFLGDLGCGKIHPCFLVFVFIVMNDEMRLGFYRVCMFRRGLRRCPWWGRAWPTWERGTRTSWWQSGTKILSSGHINFLLIYSFYLLESFMMENSFAFRIFFDCQERNWVFSTNSDFMIRSKHLSLKYRMWIFESLAKTIPLLKT